ncbi:MAG: tetratricopeptide repeat protein [Candidatus Tectimicrobiota bacterium]
MNQQHTLQRALQHQQHGELTEAANLYSAVLADDPEQEEALHGLGVIACQHGDSSRGVALIRRAIAHQADNARLYYSLGTALLQHSEPQGAAAAYETAVRLDPTCAVAYHNLGVAYQHQGQWEAAASAYQAVLRLQPHAVATHSNLALVLKEQNRLTEAREHCITAIRLQPDCAAAYGNLGLIYQAQNQFVAARGAYLAALRLQPDAAAIHGNLGELLDEHGDLEAALASYNTALRYQPQNAAVQAKRATILLRQGKLAQGWKAYEWRLHLAQAPPPFPYPRWDGTPLSGKTILVYAEQGLGDEILFASCFPDLLAQAEHCVIECAPRLAPLFRRSFPGATVYGGRSDERAWLRTVPAIDVSIPAGSLPGHLRPDLHRFPAHRGYLVPDPQRLRQYQQRLATLGAGLKVGIAWRSRQERHQDPHYTALPQWHGLLTLPGIQYINLQYDHAAPELAALYAQCGVTVHTWDDIDVFYDLESTAALIAAVDLVIAPETTVTALAGALGQTVWQLRTYPMSWPALGTTASPWFPSMRVFAQQQRGAWEPVLARVQTALRDLVASATARSL